MLYQLSYASTAQTEQSYHRGNRIASRSPCPRKTVASTQLIILLWRNSSEMSYSSACPFPLLQKYCENQRCCHSAKGQAAAGRAKEHYTNSRNTDTIFGMTSSARKSAWVTSAILLCVLAGALYLYRSHRLRCCIGRWNFSRDPHAASAGRACRWLHRCGSAEKVAGISGGVSSGDHGCWPAPRQRISGFHPQHRI